MKTHKLKFARGSRTKHAPTCPCGKSNVKNPHFHSFEGYEGEYGKCYSTSCPKTYYLPTDTDNDRFVYADPPKPEQKFIDEPRRWNTNMQDVMIDRRPAEGEDFVGKYTLTYYYRDFYGKLTAAKGIAYNVTKTEHGTALFKRDKEQNPTFWPYTVTQGYYACLFYERDLSTFPSATVILIESEKTAALLRRKFKDHLQEFIYLSPGGAKLLTDSKIERLRDRRVLICYDCDEAGRAGAESAYLKLSTICRPTVVDIDKNLSDGTDLGDMYEDLDINSIRDLDKLAIQSTAISPALIKNLRGMNQDAERLTEETLQKLGEEFTVDGDKILELHGTIRNIYQDEYGITKASLLQRIEHWLGQRYEFRRNIITTHLIYKKRGEASWEKCNSNDIWRDLQHNINDFGKRVKIPRGDIDNLLDTKFVESWNPFVDYFTTLPPWDGVDHITSLANHVQCTDQNFWVEQFKKALVRSIACTLDHVDNRIVMVLVGEKQNMGKSWFIRHLCPPELREEYYKETPLTHDKDSNIALTENFIWNLEELDDLNRKEIAALKAIISTSRVKERRAYGRYETSMRRIVNFWGSTNKTEFLTDTENTRWLCFIVNGISHDYNNRDTGVKKVDISLVWAQAYHLFKSGFIYHLSVEERALQAITNHTFETMPEEKQLIQRFFRPAKPGDVRAEFKTNFDIREHLNKHTHAKSHFNEMNIGRSMIQLGYTQSVKRINKKTQRGYYVIAETEPMEYDQDESNQLSIPNPEELIDLPF